MRQCGAQVAWLNRIVHATPEIFTTISNLATRTVTQAGNYPKGQSTYGNS